MMRPRGCDYCHQLCTTCLGQIAAYAPARQDEEN